MNRALLSLAALLALGGCATNVHGVITSDERRIWVIRSGSGNDEVFRCGDGAGPDQPPHPVCVRAPLSEAAP